MKIRLEVADQKQEITLRRISDHSFDGSRHPDSPFDILGLPFGTASEFQTALEQTREGKLFFGGNINGPGMSAEYSTMSRIPGAVVGTYGEAIGALTLEREATLPLTKNPVIAVWREFSPAPDDRPLYHEVVDGLLAKYGQPSFRGNKDAELRWFFNNRTGALREDDDCNRKPDGNRFNYLTNLRHAVNLTSVLRGNEGCGISIRVNLSADDRSRLSSMTIVIEDQKLSHAQSVLRNLDITRDMLESTLKRERKGRNVTPEL
ncbi:hypothetical protein XINFAN_01653 [Pseudogemmobacter humi]|uniref:Uncharacterized protein n=2 Tax=Pseudogemmobacter humi TaxID=2483812 RepID=A0A3P5XFP8_9RHOB|nr:hypothetical protein XINFAN_01653 [Pseudogemmobacter humi]